MRKVKQVTNQRKKSELPPFSIRFTFDLPYHIRVTEGQVSEDIVIPVAGTEGRIIIHPPKTCEKRFIYESPERKVWVADTLEIDIEIEDTSGFSREEVEERIKPIAEEYLKRFLNYCRVETKQFQIDLRQDVTCHITYADQGGQEQRLGYLKLSAKLGEPPSIDDYSWQRISEDLAGVPQIPFYVEALLDAKLYQAHSDYRMAAVSAAMGIEVIVNSYMKRILGEKLIDSDRTTQSQVDRFVEEISNRLLVTVGLGLTSAVEKEILESCREAMQLRNDILHGKKKTTSSEEARKAVRSLEQLMSAKEIQETMNRGQSGEKG